MVFSPDSKFIVASGVHNVYVWKMATGTLLTSDFSLASDVSSLGFTHDSALLATGEKGWIDLWSVKKFPQTYPSLGSATIDANINTLYDPVIFTTAFTPDNAIIAGGTTDNTIWLWNMNTFKKINVLHGSVHKSPINDLDDTDEVSFSPDGRELASLDDTGIVLLWAAHATR